MQGAVWTLGVGGGQEEVPALQAVLKIRAYTDWGLLGEKLEMGSHLRRALNDRPITWDISLPMYPRVCSVEG